MENIEPDRISLDEFFFRAAVLASMRSTCHRRKCGAVLVSDRRILATGYNGPPSGLEHCGICLRDEHAAGTHLDNCRAVHAEMNVVVQCAKTGVNIGPSPILYTLDSPCTGCAKVLINLGVISIRYIRYYPNELAVRLLQLAGVELQMHRQFERLLLP